MNSFVTIVLLVAVVGWVVYGLSRVQVAWDRGERETTELRKTFTSAGLALLRDVETIQKLDDEIKRVKDKTATARREQQDRHAMLSKSARPPPPDIYVTSEFPPSQKELAWIASFMRDPRVPAVPGEHEPKPMLIWGHTQAAALHRARQLIQEYKAYSVGSVGPFHTS